MLTYPQQNRKRKRNQTVYIERVKIYNNFIYMYITYIYTQRILQDTYVTVQRLGIPAVKK